MSHFSVSSSEFPHLQQELVKAVKNEDIPLIEELLDLGAQINHSSPACLHIMTGENMVDLMQYCLKWNGRRGIDLSEVPQSMLKNSVQSSSFEVALLLLKNHKSLGWQLDPSTLLYVLKHALISGHLTTVKFVCSSLSLPAPTSLFDLEESGESVYVLASYSNNVEVLSFVKASNECFISVDPNMDPLWQSIITENFISASFWVNDYLNGGLDEKLCQMLTQACIFYHQNRLPLLHRVPQVWLKLDELMGGLPLPVQHELSLLLQEKNVDISHMPRMQGVTLKRQLKEALPEKAETDRKKM